MQNHNQNKIVCFTMPKIGEQEADIQDACCWSTDGSQVAIADGASTSLLPRKWAELLVQYFCNYEQESIESIYQQWEEWLRPVQEEWRKFWLAEIQKKNAPWNVKAIRKENYGSAAFVGIKFQPLSEAGQNPWQAFAVGDSCLFQFKANSNKLAAFPINRSENFSTVTDCFHSLPEYNSSKPVWKTGLYESGDVFILATDALAEWIIKEYNSGSDRWKRLITVPTQEKFEDFIEQLRGDREIKNDDTTLCRIEIVIPKPPPPPPVEEDRKWQIFAAVVGVIIIGMIAIWLINKKPDTQATVSQNSPATSIPTNQKSTASGDNLPTGNNSNIATIQTIPLYAADNTSSNQPIGYLWKKPSGSEILQLWVHTPKAYIKKEQDKFFMTIPARSTPLPLYIGKPIPQKLLPQDFTGYLLPGNYLALDKPKESSTFKDAQWVKIQVRFKK